MAPTRKVHQRLRTGRPYRNFLEQLEMRTMLSAATPLGVNIEGLADWSRSFMFVDAMKSTRAFGSPNSPWDQAALIGPDGWPTGDFGACVITINTPQLSLQDFPSIGGTYHLSAVGYANIAPTGGSQLTVSNWNYDPLTNTTTADVNVAANAAYVFLKFTGTDGGLKDVKLIRPGYAADTTQEFTNAFLQSLQGFQTLRFMDFTTTNNNPIVEWSQRTLPTDPIQTSTNGAAWEYAIDLANATGKDMWINVPSQASDDYVTQLATLLKNELNPGIHVYLEYSNEVWNGGFQQAQWNYAAAQAEEAADPSVLNYDDSNNPWSFAWRRIVEQLEHDASLFANVYGQAAMNDTIRPVLASQVGFADVVRDQLNFLEHFYGAPNQTIYAIAGAPYLGIGSDSNSPTLTTDQIFADLQNNIAATQLSVERYSALAAYYRIKNLTYEGGTDLEGDTSGNYLAAKLPANYDPRMAGIVSQYLSSLYAAGVDQAVYYNESGAYGTWGAWGLTEDINNLTGYKFAAVNAFTSQARPAVTAGTVLPGSGVGGSVTIDAGSYIADMWQNTGTGGDVNAGSGATYDYLLNSPDGSAATLTLNVASGNSSGQLQVLLDDQSLETLNIPNSGGQTVQLTVNLPIAAAGLHTVRLVVAHGGFVMHTLDLAVEALPTGLSAETESPSQIDLSWNTFPQQTGMFIERSTDGTNWTQIGSTAIPGDANHDGKVDLTDLTILSGEWQQHVTPWTGADFNGDGMVDLSDLTLLAGNWQAVTPAASNSFRDMNVQAGVTYYYRIRAVTAAGTSGYSAVKSATTPPAAPVNVVPTATSATDISLTWTASDGAASYAVQRSLDGANWGTVATTTSVDFDDTLLLPGTRYYYRILAADAQNDFSDPSMVVSTTTLIS